MISRRSFNFGILISLTSGSKAFGQQPKRPDLADIASGTYDGDVISDARGSSRSNVSIRVTRTGPNAIFVASNYQRLEPFRVKLSKYMNTIQNVDGPEVFLLDLSKNPLRLDITVDFASWSGLKSG